MPHPLTRRQLLRSAGLFGLAGLAAACGRNRSALAPDAPLAPTLAVADDDGDDAPPLVCAPTADNIEGPFFKAGAPHRADLAAGVRGVAMVIGGRVLGADCRPLAGATLDVWHADSAGDYDNTGWRLRGRLTSAADGTWLVHSIVPGRYLNGPRYRPRHVHVKLTAAGHQPLTTQLYFPGDEYNHGDPWFDPALLFTVAGASRDAADFRGGFDFVLSAA